MKVKINGVEVEGKPADLAKLVKRLGGVVELVPAVATQPGTPVFVPSFTEVRTDIPVAHSTTVTETDPAAQWSWTGGVQ